MTRVIWQTTRFMIDLTRPRVMGIVNVTPDSFSDGGAHATTEAALRHCRQLIEEGADILDIGGESTRPGSPPVPVEEELARVIPVVREAVKLHIPISVDTCKPEVMRAALDLGVDIINDVWALRQPGAIELITGHSSCGVCLMHMHRDPQTMQAMPMSANEDVVEAVYRFLASRSWAVLIGGLDARRLVIDPGIGFGKTVEQNFALLARLGELVPSRSPLVVGWSRKSALGAVTGIEAADQRVAPSVVAAVLAVERGASIVRVHDVRETVAALAVWRAMKQEEEPRQ